MTPPPPRVLKHTHACVEVQRGPDRIVVDPGALGQPPSLDGCGGVLISHGHYDHADVPLLEQAVKAEIPVFGPADLGATVGSQALAAYMTVLRPGEHHLIGGFSVDVVGGRHAAVHPEHPGPENLGYMIDGRILITGDEHPHVDAAVDVLVTPVDAPWLRAVDLIDFVRRVEPGTVIGVHDGLLNDAGLAVADAVLTSLTREGAGSAVRLDIGDYYDLSPGAAVR